VFDESFSAAYRQAWKWAVELAAGGDEARGAALGRLDARFRLTRQRMVLCPYPERPLANLTGRSAQAAFLLCLVEAARAALGDPGARLLDAGTAVTATVEREGTEFRLGPVEGLDDGKMDCVWLLALRDVVVARENRREAEEALEDARRHARSHERDLRRVPVLRPCGTAEEALAVCSGLVHEVLAFLDGLADALSALPWRLPDGTVATVERMYVQPEVWTEERRDREREEPEGGRAAAAVGTRTGETLSALESERAVYYELPGAEQREARTKRRWDEVWRLRRRLVIKGAPGSGKTFLTRHAAVAALRESAARLRGQACTPDNVPLVLWVTASGLAESGAGTAGARLVAALRRRWHSLPPGEALGAWLADRIEHTDTTVVVDGLDEVTDPVEFTEAARALDSLSKVRLVATCRTLQWGEIWQHALTWRGVTAVELVPLDRRRQRQIVRRHFGDGGIDLAAQVESTLSRNTFLRDACGTPLLLTYACLLQGRDTLPAEVTYAGFYRLVTEMLLDGEFRDRSLTLPWRGQARKRSEVLRLLAGAAWRIFREAPAANRFAEDTWQEALAGAQETIRGLGLQPWELESCLEGLGVLVSGGRDRRGSPTWSFCHRTVLEFLAALGLSHESGWLEEAKKHFRFDPEWREVLKFLAGLVEDPGPLLDAVGGQEDDIFSSLLALACELAGAAGPAPGMAERRVALLELALARRRAEPELARMCLEDGLGGLCVSDADGMAALALVRRHAAHPQELVQIAALLRHPAFVPDLVAALQDPSCPMRKDAAEALGEIGDTSAVPALIAALGDRSRTVRTEAADALGEMGSVEAVPALIGVLDDFPLGVLNDFPDRQRWAAARALGQIGDASAVSALAFVLGVETGDITQLPVRVRLELDPSFLVRWYAVEALDKIGAASAVPILIAAMQDRSPRVRCSATRALDKIGAAPAVPALIAALQDLPDEGRRNAAEALGETGDTSAVPALITAMRDVSNAVRRSAAGALGRIGDASAVPVLTAALHDEGRLVRRAATRALGQIGTPLAVLALTAVLLGATDHVQAEDELDREEPEWDHKGRSMSAEALGLASDPSAIPALIAAMQDEEAKVKAEAALALGRLGATSAAPALMKAVQDKSKWVRDRATSALGRVGDASAVRALLDARHGGGSWDRPAADVALWGISQRTRTWISTGWLANPPSSGTE
jgi:HEAT repeat protein